MKNIKGFRLVMLFALAFGITSFTPNNFKPHNDEVFTCFIYRAELSVAKWNEIAEHHSFTEYIVIDESSLGASGYIISKANYNGVWEDLMSCLGLPPSILSIIIAEELDGT